MNTRTRHQIDVVLYPLVLAANSEMKRNSAYADGRHIPVSQNRWTFVIFHPLGAEKSEPLDL